MVSTQLIELYYQVGASECVCVGGGGNRGGYKLEWSYLAGTQTMGEKLG